MRFSPKIALMLMSVPAMAQSSSAKNVHASIKPTAKHKTAAVKHTEGMDVARATAIQTALIKQGYLTGQPSGRWDSESVAAMQKLQGDNGWQTKITPDSRALIKLGLGPTTGAASGAASGVSETESPQ